ncbi:MAG: chemotaxis protein CheW [Pseudomonadota bacterium]
MDDLITEFLTETNESLGELDLDLVKLEQNPNDKDLLSNIFRLMHTIKGTCGFLGLPRLEKVAHHAENIMGRFRDGELEVTPEYVTLIFESLDCIKDIMSAIEDTGEEPAGDDSDLIERLDAVYEGRDVKTDNAPEPANEPEQEPVSSALEPDEHGFTPTLAPSHPDYHKQQQAEEPPQPEQEPVAEASPPKEEVKDEEPPAEKVEKTSAVAAQSLRVNVDVLEDLMTMVSELVLTRNQLLQTARHNKETEFEAPLQRLNHVVSELQEGVMKTRMQPIGNAWSKLPRIIRDLSMELGKKIDLKMTGQDTELDRQVLEMIKDPLTHMVRNSADHGIEMPDERAATGKPETGSIWLNAYHEGGHIIIEIKDDGKGLNTEKIKEKILNNGLATAEELEAMSAQQIHQHVFKAGFSTAEKVTAVSGRGVGMDVVRTNIEKIGGSIELLSKEGEGSTFSIKIPLTLAIVSALIVEAAAEKFAIPQLVVRELVLLNEKSDNKVEFIKGSPVLRLRDQLLPLVYLDNVLSLQGGKSVESEEDVESLDPENQYIVVTQIGAYLFGIIVDKVFDTEEIVVKPVAGVLKEIEMFSGNTILGDGSVIMILDPAGIAKASGELEAGESRDTEQEELEASIASDKTSLLLFKAGDTAPKAVPLSLVARLEEIKLTDIEYSDDKAVIQYRDELMALIPFYPSMDLNADARKPVLVFTDNGRSMGLIIDSILDIVDIVIDVQLQGTTPGLMGSAIIDGKATDIVDIGHYLRSHNKDWFKTHGDEPYGEKDAGSTRILLVDDSPFFRNMLTPLLKVAGYNVTTMESAVDALKVCESGERFDMIISDIEMPEMDGFEFAEKLRASNDWKDTPLLALSSHATPQDIDRGQEVGFSRYIAKFDKDTLLSTINQTLVDISNDTRKMS